MKRLLLALTLVALAVVGWLWWLRPRETMLVSATHLVETPIVPGGPTRVEPAMRVALHDDARSVLPGDDAGGAFTYGSPEIVIPARATLAFAIGASVPRGDHGRVSFEVQACEGKVCDVIFSDHVAVDGADTPWLERRLSLAPLAGARRSLVFHALADAPGPHPFWADPTILVPASRGPHDRNLILISIDTLRADHLETYGYRRETAPFIADAFERHGTVFDHCVAAATTTSAAHMTMFTSLPPSVHGVGLTSLRALPNWLPTLPEVLRAAGFATAGITEDAWVGAGFGFGRGFGSYVENKSPNLMEPIGQVDVTFGAAKEWLRGHRDQRFFLFLHTYQVHFPYAPPPAYAPLFGDTLSDAAPASERDAAANYDREIRYTDDTLRDLFATIRELGLERDTVVVLTADHGEEFLEHGCIFHGPNLYQEVTHVPLMLWGAGVPAGVRVAEPVGTIDVMPTMLELAGVSIPSQAMGTSLAGALAGQRLDGTRPLVTEAWSGMGTCTAPDGTTLRFANPGIAVRVGSLTMARYHRNDAVQYELYDLAADPGERHDRYGEGGEAARPLQAVLDAHEQSSRQRVAVYRGAPVGVVEPSPALDARQRDKLRALGYAE